jgi:hypothetical protein
VVEGGYCDITPDYNDNIKEQLQEWSGEKLKGCLVPVRLRIDFAIDNNGNKISKTEKYTIVEITGELIKPIEQQDLEM